MVNFFINRPILSGVVSIIITLLGALALVDLPLEQYPQIAPPVVQVQTTFPGANATTVAESVAAPIEQQVNGAKGMIYMDSRSTNDGGYRLNVTFEVGTDPDLAAVEVQNRLAIATPQLPPEVVRQGVTVRKAATGFLQIISLTSPDGRYDNVFLSNYATLYLFDAVSRVPGVGQVTIFGARDYSMRLWLDPDKMTRLGVTATDVQAVLAEQNVVAPAGRIGSAPIPPGQQMNYSVTVRGRLADPVQFGNIVVRTAPGGQIVRLRDFARVELAAADYAVSTTVNGKPTVLMAIFPQPTANALDVAKGVKQTMETLRLNFPQGVEYFVSFDAVPFITESLKQVLVTLGEAFILVALVVFVFLQSWRATIIPIIAVPVSLIGTFAALAAFGFSINTLTLFALVLAIGMVVDDAIVVVEAVEQKMHDLKMGPREATYAALADVAGPVIAIALVLCAVFVPVAFLGGLAGQLYKQFALTLSIAVVLSAIVALTLTPALCALLLRPQPEGKRRGPLGWFYNGFNWGFANFTQGYTASIRAIIRWWLLGIVIFGLLIGYTVWVGKRLPTGLLPSEDQAYLIATVNLPLASSAERTTVAVSQLSEIALRHPAVERVQVINGLNTLTFVTASYQATLIIVLKPWAERLAPNLRADAVRLQLMGMLGSVRDASVLVFNPTPIRGVGSAGGFEFVLQDRSGGTPQRFGEVLQGLLAEARRQPELGFVATQVDGRVPQIEFDIDRDRAKLLGVRLNDIYLTMQMFLGGLYINDLNLFGRTYRVVAQAEGRARTSPEDVARFHVRNADGGMVPLSTLATPRTINGPDFVQRYNLYRAALINGQAAPGYSSGDAIATMERLAAALPPGYTFEWSGATFQEKRTGGQTGAVFFLAILFTFLLLAALYESWTLPTAILLAIPFGALGAFTSIWLRAFDNNVYTQIGLVMLVGLAAKNAILIVEYAKLARERGQDIVEAAVAGSRLRLRPILMTSFAFIFGALPLAISYGAGSGARQVLGTAVVAGMAAATFIGIFFIPMFYVLMQRVSEWRVRNRQKADADPAVEPVGE
jgi:HAE1 family hydrophobic/amphiphilic exporter-1/multidrug efflux pump